MNVSLTWTCRVHAYRQTLTDINECDVSNGGCSHNCINTEVECSCNDGYVLGFDAATCSGTQAI